MYFRATCPVILRKSEDLDINVFITVAFVVIRMKDMVDERPHRNKMQ